MYKEYAMAKGQEKGKVKLTIKEKQDRKKEKQNKKKEAETVK
jgi:hypothetical protein